jgi:hypothetical protein
VDNLLEDQMPAGVIVEVGDLQQGLEQADVAVQVADNHHLAAIVEGNDVSFPAGGRSHEGEGLPENGQHPIGSRHRARGLGEEGSDHCR